MAIHTATVEAPLVRAPWSEPANVDPEEAYIAALASCHMLWFLSLAAADGWRIDRYEDAAQGRMARNADGRDWVAEVELDPQVTFGGDRRPDDAAFAQLHHRAHEECFLANSVKTAIEVRGRWQHAG